MPPVEIDGLEAWCIYAIASIAFVVSCYYVSWWFITEMLDYRK